MANSMRMALSRILRGCLPNPARRAVLRFGRYVDHQCRWQCSRHTNPVAGVPEKGPQCFRAAGDRHTGPTLLAFPGKERVHVDQRNVAESTILFLKPLQKLLDV